MRNQPDITPGQVGTSLLVMRFNSLIEEEINKNQVFGLTPDDFDGIPNLNPVWGKTTPDDWGIIGLLATAEKQGNDPLALMINYGMWNDCPKHDREVSWIEFICPVDPTIEELRKPFRELRFYSCIFLDAYTIAMLGGGTLLANSYLYPTLAGEGVLLGTQVAEKAEKLGFIKNQVTKLKKIVEIKHNWLRRNTLGSLRDPGHIEKVKNGLRGLRKSVKYLKNGLPKMNVSQRKFAKEIIKEGIKLIKAGEKWLK